MNKDELEVTLEIIKNAIGESLARVEALKDLILYVTMPTKVKDRILFDLEWVIRYLDEYDGREK